MPPVKGFVDKIPKHERDQVRRDLLDYCHRYALAMVRLVETLEGLASCSIMRPTRANKPNGYLLGSYRIANAPEPNRSLPTGFKSTRFASPANHVSPQPANPRGTTNS